MTEVRRAPPALLSRSVPSTMSYCDYYHYLGTGLSISAGSCLFDVGGFSDCDFPLLVYLRGLFAAQCTLSGQYAVQESPSSIDVHC